MQTKNREMFMAVQDREANNLNARDVRRTFWDRFWRNKNGKIIIWQFPNPPLYMWAAATVLQYILPHNLRQVAQLFAFGSMFTVGYIELYRGVNYFRRLLGLFILIGIIASAIK